MRIVSVAGARPQFIKLSVVCRALEEAGGVEHRIIHTGQHYDDAMSGAFFRELSIPDPSINLAVGSGSHATQTAEMMRRLEPVLTAEHPDWVLLYGDTNSTAAAAIVAAKLNFRLAHIEAGLRSFNRSMPEEINRIMADHLSELLFCPTAASMENLAREGLGDRSRLTGDVMLDAVLQHVATAEARAISPAFEREPGSYALATIHRAENTNSPDRLLSLMSVLEDVSANLCPVVLLVHPRTRKVLSELGWMPTRVNMLAPVSYLDMLLWEKRARVILTDSGGVQKEAYFLQVPCITLRCETEWVETLENNCNVLAGAADTDQVCSAVEQARSAGPWSGRYGDGNAGHQIVSHLRD